MSSFLTTLLISFGTVLLFALILNYCRRRYRKTRHGLTAMCHKNGGPACSTCSDTEGNKSR